MAGFEQEQGFTLWGVAPGVVFPDLFWCRWRMVHRRETPDGETVWVVTLGDYRRRGVPRPIIGGAPGYHFASWALVDGAEHPETGEVQTFVLDRACCNDPDMAVAQHYGLLRKWSRIGPPSAEERAALPAANQARKEFDHE